MFACGNEIVSCGVGNSRIDKVRRRLECACGRPPTNVLSHGEVAQCTHRQVASSTLNVCMNLAPAGTGSSTLAQQLWRANATLAHHVHTRRLPVGAAAPSCALMTARDPSERLESAFRFELNPCTRSRDRSLTRHFGSASELVHALSEAQHPKHAQASTLYQRSVFQPQVDPRHYGDILTGSNFLTAQVDYLRGLDCARTELHILCTSTLTADWAHLVRRRFVSHRELLGARAGGVAGSTRQDKVKAPYVGRIIASSQHSSSSSRAWKLMGGRWVYARLPTVEPLNQRRGGDDPSQGVARRNLNSTIRYAAGNRRYSHGDSGDDTDCRLGEPARRLATLSEAEREYVRRVLYPWDTLLHQTACGARARRELRQHTSPKAND